MHHDLRVYTQLLPISATVNMVPATTTFSNELLASAADSGLLLCAIPVILDHGIIIVGTLTVASRCVSGAEEVLVADIGHLQPQDKTAFISAFYREIISRDLPLTIQKNYRAEMFRNRYLDGDVSLEEIQRGQHLLNSITPLKIKKKDRELCNFQS